MNQTKCIVNFDLFILIFLQFAGRQNIEWSSHYGPQRVVNAVHVNKQQQVVYNHKLNTKLQYKHVNFPLLLKQMIHKHVLDRLDSII